MPLTDVEWDSVLSDPSKRIDGDIEWVEDEYRSPARCFRAKVDSTAGWGLLVHGRYNPLAETLSYTLFLNTEGRIYGLDMGKEHHNPQCDRVGDPHKHRWSERYRDKEAYVPKDITAPISDPVSVWKQFCAEAGIDHNGQMQSPPALNERLFT